MSNFAGTISREVPPRRDSGERLQRDQLILPPGSCRYCGQGRHADNPHISHCGTCGRGINGECIQCKVAMAPVAQPFYMNGRTIEAEWLESE